MAQFTWEKSGEIILSGFSEQPGQVCQCVGRGGFWDGLAWGAGWCTWEGEGKTLLEMIMTMFYVCFCFCLIAAAMSSIQNFHITLLPNKHYHIFCGSSPALFVACIILAYINKKTSACRYLRWLLLQTKHPNDVMQEWKRLYKMVNSLFEEVRPWRPTKTLPNWLDLCKGVNSK